LGEISLIKTKNMKKNAERRYRFNHYIANKVGVIINKQGRYRLTPEQEN